MPKDITKTTRKRQIIRKKKRTLTPKKVPKTDPKQQTVLKTLFVAQRSGTKKRSSGNKKRSPGTRRCPSSPPSNQQVWRRTVMRNKPKPKPKEKLPRLFRMDDQTGLPMDYERTVDRVMHYVNPHLASHSNADEEMEELLTNVFMGMMQHGNPKPKIPAHKCCCRDGNTPGSMCCREQQTKRYLQALLKGNPCQFDQFSRNESTKQSKQQANEDLTDFYSACKRGPRQIRPNLGPTKASKFNFNQLRIRSQ